MQADASVCNNKQRWNEDKCKCECREKLIDKRRCDKRFIWNPSDCSCQCDKSCNVGEYLDYKNCRCRKIILGELVEEYTENVYENAMIYNETLNDHKKVCSSCTLHIVLFVIFLVTSTIISSVFVYFHWFLKKNITSAYY